MPPSAKRRKRLLTPENSQYCERCTLMTLSIEGLRDLVSPRGYLHYSKSDLKLTAKSGCRLCTTIYNSLHVKTRAESEENLHFFLSRDGPRGWDLVQNISERDYPLDGLSFDDIRGYFIRGSLAEKSMKVHLTAFAAQGKDFSYCLYILEAVGYSYLSLLS
jgi:hypothetical protein